jgi:hypothetical protein
MVTVHGYQAYRLYDNDNKQYFEVSGCRVYTEHWSIAKFVFRQMLKKKIK